MYSGFVTKNRSSRHLGVHQRFDTSAYKMIRPQLKTAAFPGVKRILHFEGINGPDGVKVKSPGVQDPSHMYDPIGDKGILPELLTKHYNGLVDRLKAGDRVRAGYEAAWLAHFVVDGLTPAHHYPYDAKKAEILGNDSEYGVLLKSWHWFGAKGVMSTHMNFEMGIASMLVSTRLKLELDQKLWRDAQELGYLDFFKREAREVANLGLYDQFYKKGWTQSLARTIKKDIAPHSVQVTAIIWLMADHEAASQENKK